MLIPTYIPEVQYRQTANSDSNQFLYIIYREYTSQLDEHRHAHLTQLPVSCSVLCFFCVISIIIKAEGEARAAELVGKAIQKNPAFIQLRRIEAAKEVATTVSGSQNKIYLNADNLLLNHLGEAPSLATGGTEKSKW